MLKGADERKQGGEVDFDCVILLRFGVGGPPLGIFWARAFNLSPEGSPPQGAQVVKMGLSRGAIPLLRLHGFFISRFFRSFSLCHFILGQIVPGNN